MIYNDVEITGLKEVQNLLENFPEDLNDIATDLVKEATYDIDDKISKRVRKGGGGALTSRTGELRRSIQPRISGKKSFDTLKARVFTNNPYAPIHETGGTIRAKKAFRNMPGGPYLAIPSDMNKTPSGVTRKTVRQSFNSGGYIQKIKNPKSARYMIMSETGTPEHWLVKQVTIPARLEFRKTFEDEIPTLIQKLDYAIKNQARTRLARAQNNKNNGGI